MPQNPRSHGHEAGGEDHRPSLRPGTREAEAHEDDFSDRPSHSTARPADAEPAASTPEDHEKAPRRATDPIAAADDLVDHLTGRRAALNADALLRECDAKLPMLLAELQRRGYLRTLLERHTLAMMRAARAARVVPASFRHITEAGLYDTLCEHMPRTGRGHDDLLSDWAAARPDFGEATLNAAAWSSLADSDPGDYDFDALIVPGYTPLRTHKPLGVRDLSAAQQRLDLAFKLYRHGVAPVVIVSGGCVHPPGTPINEALSMREYLLEEGCPEPVILLEPYARHTTTNLRNAGRILRESGRSRGLIVTGFDSPVFSQAFYLSNPTLSTFFERCRQELGYIPGDLRAHAENQIAFSPSDEVTRRTLHDPWDA